MGHLECGDRFLPSKCLFCIHNPVNMFLFLHTFIIERKKAKEHTKQRNIGGDVGYGDAPHFKVVKKTYC